MPLWEGVEQKCENFQNLNEVLRLSIVRSLKLYIGSFNCRDRIIGTNELYI